MGLHINLNNNNYAVPLDQIFRNCASIHSGEDYFIEYELITIQINVISGFYFLKLPTVSFILIYVQVKLGGGDFNYVYSVCVMCIASFYNNKMYFQKWKVNA